jgi:putative peptide-modifying radical SAM enzyme
MENLKLIRSRGFEGDLIARMAFSDRGDIYRDVMHLLTTEDGIFDHVHWQLDVFWTDLDSRGDVKGWIDRYDEGIQRLISEFGMSFYKGRILGIVPFIPVMNSIISGKASSIRCGSGIDSFSVMTSGEIHACPIAPEMLYSKVGDIHSSTPDSIRGSRRVGDPCPECDIFDLCGGRCLHSNMTMYWGREWFDRVCMSTRRMIEGLIGLRETASNLMDDGALPREAFCYPEINNGCEIIP